MRCGKKTLEFKFYIDGNACGEIAVWFPSSLSKSLNQIGIADIEYIEINNEFRGKRFGQVALMQMKQYLSNYSFNRFMLWTEVDNQQMIRLAERAGFEKGPILHWFCTNL